MSADVLLTIAFTLYAVLIAVGVGYGIARNWNAPALDEAAEKRFNGVARAAPRAPAERARSPGQRAPSLSLVRPGPEGDEVAARWRLRGRLHDPGAR
jgi:hypothetical protein